MGAKHITAQEKELFQVLVNTGLSMQKVATLTGRDAGTVSNHVTSTVSKQMMSDDTKPVGNIHLTQDEMFSMLDLHAQGMTCTQIGKEVGKAHGTVYKVINQLYPKHKKTYAKWIELQGQREAPVDPVVPSALAAIRAAREAGRIATLNQEESPALVMEVQTVESKPCDCDCNFTDSKICEAMSYSIKNQKAIIANHEESIKNQSLLIVECQETITLLKEHIQLLKSLR
jgi:predicted transcriptional regulator